MYQIWFRGPLLDVINSAEFCCSRLVAFDCVGGQNSPSPIDLAGRRYQSAGATAQLVILLYIVVTVAAAAINAAVCESLFYDLLLSPISQHCVTY